MTDQKIWFITWVSTWFGRCLLDEVLRKGDIVIGTLRKQEQIDEFRNLYPKDAYFYLLDGRDEKWVQEISTEVINKFWKIDILVNNAWYGLTWAIEEASMPEIRDQMETNFFGAILSSNIGSEGLKMVPSASLFEIICSMNSRKSLILFR